MPLAVYVHIPYCLQRCRYCDFATFEFTEILPPERYTEWVLQEIRNRRPFWRQTEIQTLYFGGGTPSLISPELIVAIKNELAISGFTFRTSEITLEINPATLDEAKLNKYLEAGFNRFSVGAQTFHDGLLKVCGRKHNAADTHSTLQLLRRYNVNYSFDLLFALPGQTLQQVHDDLDIVTEYSPPHLSAYCLTVPQGHPMSTGRAPENEQIEMFAVIESRLRGSGLEKYEISNFAKPGFESRHNGVYWNDQSYWGIGLSSHSYSRDLGEFGTRFWNPKSIAAYGAQAGQKGVGFTEVLPSDQREQLQMHESLTDFCHMHLRTREGLAEDALQNRFPARAFTHTLARLDKLVSRGWLERKSRNWQLTAEGQLISNKVFEELCFLPDELRPEALTPQGADSYCSV
jgi:oxygen-independent coproporphyrinogen-3 oxidase